MAGTTTFPATRTAPQTAGVSALDPGWKVLLFNDDVTPFDIVILGLQRAAGLSMEVAEMVALEAHEEDVAVVRRGLSEEDAQIICGGLRKWTRVPNVCPGVSCEAVRDED